MIVISCSEDVHRSRKSLLEIMARMSQDREAEKCFRYVTRVSAGGPPCDLATTRTVLSRRDTCAKH
jgi:hypothetical protein